MKNIILGCLIASPLTLFAADESCPQAINVVVALDSSGSLYSEYQQTYQGWEFEIDRAKELVDLHDVGFGKTNVAITNSSGCPTNTTYVDCVDNVGRFKTEQTLSSDPVVISELLTYDSIDENTGLGPAEFLRGTSWTDWTLYYAKEQLAGSNQIDPRQVIILFSDKEPYPESHKLCDEEGYKSDSLQAVQDAGIDLFIIKLQDDEQSDACAVPVGDHANVRGDFTGWSDFLAHYELRITGNPDNDALCGDADVCPNDANNDYDSDSICGDLDVDDDNDGVADAVDDCALGAIGSGSAPIGSDIDNDGCESAEDSDDDGDNINDADDAYPNIAIAGLTDTDGDGAPDSCEAVECLGMTEDGDDDNDGILDEKDAYPKIAIGGLTDVDADGSPDSCAEKDCLGMLEDELIGDANDIKSDIELTNDVETSNGLEPTNESKGGGALSILSMIMLFMLTILNRGYALVCRDKCTLMLN